MSRRDLAASLQIATSGSTVGLYRQGDTFVNVSARDFAEKVKRLAAGLVALGIEPGSRVCIFSKSRIEFAYLDYAIWAAGCATVTIYESSSPDQVEWIVGNSDARLPDSFLGPVACSADFRGTRSIQPFAVHSVQDAQREFRRFTNGR